MWACQTETAAHPQAAAATMSTGWLLPMLAPQALLPNIPLPWAIRRVHDKQSDSPLLSSVLVAAADPSLHYDSSPLVCTDLVNYVEFPADGPSLGQLQAFAQPGSAKPERFAWLSEAGIFHGHLDLHRLAIPATELDYLPRRGLLPFPGMGAAHGSGTPLALVGLRICGLQVLVL